MSMKQVEVKFTPVELNHIWSLLAENDYDGVYSGPKKQYWDRAKRIKDKISAAIGEHCGGEK